MGNRVPATALSVNTPDARAVLALGSTVTPAPSGSPGYWYVVVDLTNGLSVVASEFSADGTAAPLSIAAMLGDSSFFLFFVAQNVAAGSLPSGELATFLDAAGSGSHLAALQQTAAQLGAAAFPSVSYVLAATLNDQDLPGFEESSLWHPAVLNMQFLPLEVGDRTVYAPIQVGTQVSPTMVRAVQSAGMAPSVVYES